jgi:DNA-directed RNA polymerase
LKTRHKTKAELITTTEFISTLQSTLKDPYIRPKLWIDWGLNRSGGLHNSIIERLTTKRSQELVELLIDKYYYQENEEIFIFQDENGGHDEEAWSNRFGYLMQAFYH